MDNDLYAQMINRKIVPSNTGLMCIESKIAMKDPNRDGGPVPCSPDRADAVFGAMAPLPQYQAKRVMGDFENQEPLASKLNPLGKQSRRQDAWEREEQEGYIPGTYTG